MKAMHTKQIRNISSPDIAHILAELKVSINGKSKEVMEQKTAK